MSISEKQLYMPTRLNDPLRILYWDFDQFLIVATMFSLGVISKYIFTLTAVGLFVSWAWQRFKSGKHMWFLLHGLYWFLPLSGKSLSVPSTDIREFLR